MKKALKLCGLTACCAVMLSSYTCAYIDPSVMTYTIQAIAGVVIAVGAVAGIYWRKAKKKVNEKLGLDENRNKEVESDVLEIKEDDVEPQINVTATVNDPAEKPPCPPAKASRTNPTSLVFYNDQPTKKEGEPFGSPSV